MRRIIPLVILVLMILPVVSADVILSEVNESSGILLDKNPNVELRNATVSISPDYLEAYFYIYSNEEVEKEVIVYLKAKGQDCYGECNPINPQTHATTFNINNERSPGSIGRGGILDNNEGVSSFAEEYEIGEQTFAGINFTLLPKQVNVIKISHEDIYLPFEYYLDSLSTFKKADYEKITITGENLKVEFNEHYPVQKISDNEWVWEYSDIDTSDENLKDILRIEQIDAPIPKQNFFQRIWGWFRNLFS
jgi:hypothetical protein